MRTIETRVNVLRNGAKLSSLLYDTPPHIAKENGSAIKSSLSGTFYPDEKINWLSDQLQPVVIIDGIEYPIGLYDPATVNKTRSESGANISVEAYDYCWRVQSYRTDDLLHLSAGTNYLTAVKTLLAEAGIGLIIETPTTAALRNDREDWETGTDYLTIINKLLSEINYNELWFNSTGSAMLQPKAELSATTAARTYDKNNVKSLMLRDSSVNMDLFNAPNVFVCVCSNPDDNTPMKATEINNNPSSPLSVARRGRRIYQVERVDNVASLSALQDYARLRALEYAMLAEQITISTGIIPDCGLNETVAIIHEDVEGLCIETGWSMELTAGGTMQHNLKKAVLTI